MAGLVDLYASCFNHEWLVTLFPQLSLFPGAWGNCALNMDFSKWPHAVSLSGVFFALGSYGLFHPAGHD